MPRLRDPELRLLETRFRRVVTIIWWIPVAVSAVLQTFLGFGAPADALYALLTLTGLYILLTNLLAIRVLGSLLHRALARLEAAEDAGEPPPPLPELRRLRTTFVFMFLAFALLGPVVAYANLEMFEDRNFSAGDYLFASLGALPSVLIAAFPILFYATDLISRTLAPRGVKEYVAPLSVRFAVLGLASPVVIDTVLLLYYRDRTGFLEVETVVLWLALLVLAGVGTLTAYRSLRSSLRPLEEHALGPGADDVKLAPRSLDEVGDLTARWSELLADRALAERRLAEAQRAEAMGRLTGGIAHDFNNVLMTVQGSLEVAKEEASEAPAVLELLDEALRGCRRAKALTRGLLAASGRRPLRPRPLRASRVVEDAWKLLLPSVGASIALTVDIPADEWACEADPDELSSALLNLVINARDAVQDGGNIRITVGAATIVHDAILTAGDYVTISVVDDGPGIDDADIGHIFEPFYTTKAVGQGTGLGLASVKGFAEQSRGGVTVERRSGAEPGTVFTIYLPRTTETPSDEIDRKEVMALRGRGERILLIEDEPGVRALVRAQLVGLGYATEEAVSAKDVLDRLSELERPQLIVSDVVMPGASGPALVAQLRQHWVDVPVLYISGYTRDHLMRGGRLPADVELLEKPFTRERLAERVRRLLDAVPAREANV